MFWKQSAERAIKTLAQFIIVLGAGSQFNVFSLDWQQTLGAAVGGVVLSFATSIASESFGDRGTPSLIKEEK